MRISIVGAYGYTGVLICEELEKARISFSVFGRNKQKLEALKAQNTSVLTALELDMRVMKDVQQIIDISDIIVNCAGPFTEEANLLVECAAHNSKIYLDITGEIGFVKNSRIQFHHVAIKNSALLVHGCAFESLVSDLLIQSLVNEKNDLQSIKTFYSFNQKKISPGTRITMKLSKYRELLKVEDGLWRSGDSVKDQIKVKWSDADYVFSAVPYPLPEIAYAFWNYQPKSVESYLLLKDEEALFVGVGNKSNENIIETLDKLRTNKIDGPTKFELEDQKSLLAVEILDRNGLIINAVARANNMYQTTSKAISLAIKKLLEHPTTIFGVQSPAKLFEGLEKETLEALNVQLISDKELLMHHV